LSSFLGNTYINDTGLDGVTVFTGSKSFQVKEIEVFEMIVVHDLLSEILLLKAETFWTFRRVVRRFGTFR
jgi:uncharacterized membrane protein